MASHPLLIEHDKFRQIDRLRLFGAMLLTYGIGWAIVAYNPYVSNLIRVPPITISDPVLANNAWLNLFLFIIGHTPIECLTRIAVIAIVAQGLNYLTMDTDAVDLERYRPYVFWRAIYRFISSCGPFLDGKHLDGPPTSSLTQYERITLRYFFVKLIFMPMMVSFFFGTFQRLINLVSVHHIQTAFTIPFIEHWYLVWWFFIMAVDLGWFSLGCTIETSRWSPIKMVDPYASGWIFALACYPPLVSVSSQYFVWGAPEFPGVTLPLSAAIYAGIAAVLYTAYVIADLSFGLKTGNLTYRGLVDKGPYRLIRHPMYSFKTTAWIVFSLPGFNFHIESLALPSLHMSIPILAANWGMILPMFAWVSIYCMRALTEERYMLEFPEYREYCKRVKYRFIPFLV